MIAMRLYDFVLWIHVAAVVIAFGAPFIYPVSLARVTNANPEALPGIYNAMVHAGRTLITVAYLVLFLAGAYLASDAGLWSEHWVSGSLVILIVLIGLSHGLALPTEKKLSAIATTELAARGAGGGPMTFSAEYEKAYRKLNLVGLISNVLVLIALYLMIVQPA
ncbi:MAG: DUF2269 family protein [Solirubrobacteraceae bacterium]|nr:DUF2269 family protein [Solirubrobacteraceae bacterium]